MGETVKFRDFIPPAVSQAWSGFKAKVFSTAFAQAFIRGEEGNEYGRSRFAHPYAQSAWVHFAVTQVAGEIANRPVCFYAGDQQVTDPAFVAWWQAPALGPKTLTGTQPRLGIKDVNRDLASWAKLEGEFFLCFDDSWALAGLKRNPAVLSPFLIAHPNRMRLIVQGGILQGYEYIDTAGVRMIFLPEQVIHWKAFNPYDDWRGLGDLQAAKVPAEGAFLTGVYIRELMRNNGDQGFIVIGKNGVADDKQREQIVADLRAKRAALRAGIPKDIFLTGDISVDRPTERAASPELMAGLSLTHQEILVAFGVPPSMGEVKASYSVGKDSDYYQLIIRNCQPLGGQIADKYAVVGTMMTGKNLTAEMEWDDHPVMIEVRNSRIDSGQKLWASGMPWDKVNVWLGLGMPAFNGWDIAYIPFSVSPVSSDGAPPQKLDPAADPSLAELADEGKMLPEIATLRLLLAARSRARESAVKQLAIETEALAAFACNCGADCTAQKAERDPQEIARWKQHMVDRRATVKAFVSAFGRVLMKARIETLKKIEGAEGKAARERCLASAFEPGVNKAAVADFLFNVAEFATDFHAAMRKQQKSAVDTAAQQLLKEIGRDDPFSFAPHDVLSFLGDRDLKLANIPEKIAAAIRASIQEGLDAGDTQAQLSARVKKEFNLLGDTEANRIAQTETSAAYGWGRNEAMTKAHVKYKAWLTSGNANVRPAHAEAGLTYSEDAGIPLDQPFIVDGEELMYPGDSSGSPGNVINCHCVQIAVGPPDAT
jgi:hypothetical protein